MFTNIILHEYGQSVIQKQIYTHTIDNRIIEVISRSELADQYLISEADLNLDESCMECTRSIEYFYWLL